MDKEDRYFLFGILVRKSEPKTKIWRDLCSLTPSFMHSISQLLLCWLSLFNLITCPFDRTVPWEKRITKSYVQKKGISFLLPNLHFPIYEKSGTRKRKKKTFGRNLRNLGIHSREKKKKKKKFELLVFWVRMFFHFADSSSKTARLSFLQRNAVKWYGKSWWEPVTMMRIPIKWALLGYWAMEFSKMCILYMMAEPWRTSIKTIYVPEGWGFFILSRYEILARFVRAW